MMSENLILLSVIIPARNCSELPCKCLDSVLYAFSEYDESIELVLINEESAQNSRHLHDKIETIFLSYLLKKSRRVT